MTTKEEKAFIFQVLNNCIGHESINTFAASVGLSYLQQGVANDLSDTSCARLVQDAWHADRCAAAKG